ncbi:MAG: GntR family transcriptional regulator [Alphaproteobacteria bacterium]|jgi:GntR family transcriptional regulator|nr:GntR family transcriptional regulator [Alphaproteobacteria bacterium]
MALEASRQEGLIGAEAPPRYRQIAGALAAEIARGLHEPGAALPSEHQLCRLFSVSRVTVRAALQQLVEDGLIERRHGAGSFVRPRVIHKPLGGLTDFRAEAERHGRTATTRLMSLIERPASIAERMKFGAATDAVHELVRLRLLDGVPAVYQTTLLPAGLLGPSAAAMLADGSLYAYLAHRGRQPAAAEDVVEAVALAPPAALVLKLPAGSPVFRFHRTARDRAGQVVELSDSLIRSDLYKLTFHPHLEDGR